MSRTPKRPPEPWQRLLTSADLFGDLCDVFPAAFFDTFATHFDRKPHAIELFKGVIDTGRAYVRGKWLKQAEKSKLLQYSGVHLIGAGVSARRLSEALQQLSKSDHASQMMNENLAAVLAGDGTSQHAQAAHAAIIAKHGPQSHLNAIQQLASALETAVGQIIALPQDDDDEDETRQRAFAFVEDTNRSKVKTLPKNFALEEAARTFQPLWEEFSTVAYIRGRYKQEISRYDCEPGRALHLIIRELDSTVAESLAGTAIEKIRAQP